MASNPEGLSNRQVAVAKAYIDGLERDRRLLHESDEKLTQTIWEAAKLAVYSQTLTTALDGILKGLEAGTFSAELLDSAENLVSGSKELLADVFKCPCGHPTFDHDENGCNFLHCKSICN